MYSVHCSFTTWPPKKLQLSHRFWYNPTKVSHFPKLAHSRPDSTLKLLHVQLWYRIRVCGACALKFCCLFPFLKFHNGIKALEEFACQFSFYFYNWNLLCNFFHCKGQSSLGSSFLLFFFQVGSLNSLVFSLFLFFPLAVMERSIGVHVYHTRAIITRGLYTFCLIFES